MTQSAKRLGVGPRLTALGLAIAGSLVLALPGAAQGPAPVDCKIPPPATGSGAITYEDRQAILDLIANFSWVFNEPNISSDRRRAQLEAIFADEFKFQACSSDLKGFVTDDHEALFTQFNNIYNDLATNYSQSAHFVTNTVLTPIAPFVVEEKSLMALVLTDNDSPAAKPEIDYTAIVRGIIQKNPATGQWQFKNRAIIRGTSTANYAR
jgi:hypothetical protein